jgi:hypothetical protein
LPASDNTYYVAKLPSCQVAKGFAFLMVIKVETLIPAVKIKATFRGGCWIHRAVLRLAVDQRSSQFGVAESGLWVGHFPLLE